MGGGAAHQQVRGPLDRVAERLVGGQGQGEADIAGEGDRGAAGQIGLEPHLGHPVAPFGVLSLGEAVELSLALGALALREVAHQLLGSLVLLVVEQHAGCVEEARQRLLEWGYGQAGHDDSLGYWCSGLTSVWPLLQTLAANPRQDRASRPCGVSQPDRSGPLGMIDSGFRSVCTT